MPNYLKIKHVYYEDENKKNKRLQTDFTVCIKNL